MTGTAKKILDSFTKTNSFSSALNEKSGGYSMEESF